MRYIYKIIIFLQLFYGSILPSFCQEFSTPSRDGVLISYEVHGKGKPAIVFVHGWSCDRTYWKNQIEPFSKKYEVITIDLAGHGKSGTNRKVWSIESYGADVAAVVEKLKLNNLILVGHSMGGDVISSAANQIPREKIKGLVMVDTYKKLGPGRNPQQVQEIVALFKEHFQDSVRSFVRGMFSSSSNAQLIEWVANDMASAPPEIAIPSIESALSYSREITSSLKSSHLPTIAINSDNSPTDIPSMKQNNVEVIIMHGAGHFLMLEDPKQFNEILEEVIKKLSSK